MTWAFKRQLVYVGILILAIAVLGFLILLPSLQKPPSCFDGKQDGDETGIDCGGSCALACISQVSPISVLWARAFEVVPGRYNAVAYLQNHNKNDAVNQITYRFRFADQNNVYIGEVTGTTSIPPGGNFAVFEPGINVGNSIPVYVSFEFTGVPQWVQVPQAKIDELKFAVSGITLQNPSTNPSLSATLTNNSFFTIPNINVVALLYDAAGNAISASSTYISTMNPEDVKNLNFTWPEPFSSKVATEEIIPMYNIFNVQVQ